MARAGSSTHATVDVAGCSSVEVGERVGAAVRSDGSYTVAPTGPETFHLVRTYRPIWAIVLGVLGTAFFGLGILLFLVRKTESCTLKVVNGPTGAVLTITGALLPTTLTALREALDRSATAAPQPATRVSLTAPAGSPVAGLAAPEMTPPVGLPARGLPSPPALTTPAGRPVAGLAPPVSTAASMPPHSVPSVAAAGEPDVEHTVHRATAPAAGGGGYWVRLPEGRVVSLVGTTLLGRDPAPPPGEAAPTLIPLADPSMQVSKTHLALRVLGGALLVEDLHSTNGTVINEPSGWRMALSGGESAPVKPGAFLELGGVRIEVGAGG